MLILELITNVDFQTVETHFILYSEVFKKNSLIEGKEKNA